MNNCKRPEPPFAGSEKEVLTGFLDFLRGTILCKVDGLSDEELRRPHDPSGMTLLGIVKHLADVERSWFREVFLGKDLGYLWDDDDPGKYWRVEPHETTAEILGFYNAEVARARQIVTDADLDTLAHMIEETARHCGHADLIRESIDGQTGE